MGRGKRTLYEEDVFNRISKTRRFYLDARKDLTLRITKSASRDFSETIKQYQAVQKAVDEAFMNIDHKETYIMRADASEIERGEHFFQIALINKDGTKESYYADEADDIGMNITGIGVRDHCFVLVSSYVRMLLIAFITDLHERMTDYVDDLLPLKWCIEEIKNHFH